jgi:hypothetical protein
VRRDRRLPHKQGKVYPSNRLASPTSTQDGGTLAAVVGAATRIVAIGETRILGGWREETRPRVQDGIFQPQCPSAAQGLSRRYPSASREGVQGVRRSAWDQTASVSALRGRTFTTLRAAFAL